HKMLCVIAGAPRRFEKIAVTRFFLEILHPPGSPQRLQFFRWKSFLGHAFCALKLKSCAPKSSQHFNPGSARASRASDRVLAITNFENFNPRTTRKIYSWIQQSCRLSLPTSLSNCKLQPIRPSKPSFGGIIMRRSVFIFLTAHAFFLTGGILAGEQPQ